MPVKDVHFQIRHNVYHLLYFVDAPKVSRAVKHKSSVRILRLIVDLYVLKISSAARELLHRHDRVKSALLGLCLYDNVAAPLLDRILFLFKGVVFLKADGIPALSFHIAEHIDGKRSHAVEFSRHLCRRRKIDLSCRLLKFQRSRYYVHNSSKILNNI